MKQFLLFFLIVVFSACSDNDNDTSPETNPNLLAQVVITGQSASQNRIFHFNDDGKIKSIADGNDNILESYEYNTEGQLSSITIFGPETPVVTTYTYDGSHVASINGNAVTFNATTNTYTYDISGFDISVEVNSDLLFQSGFIDGEEEYDFVYNNGNLTSMISEWVQVAQYGTAENPLHEAMMPLFRALSAYYPDPYGALNMQLFGVYSSQNLVSNIDWDGSGIETVEYNYVFNDNDLPESRSSQPFVDGIPDGPSFESAHFYYQGDPLP